MAPVLPTDPTPLDERAMEFIAEHPDVWALFVRFSFELVRSGRHHGGAKSVWERIRWEAATSAHRVRNDGWALNNTHVASLSRIFAATYPAHSDFFVRRKRPTERAA